MLTTLALAGLRIGELIELRWRDVDFTEGKITVRASKTDAGMRRVDLKPRLRAELEALRARAAGRGAVQANVLDLEAHRARRRQRVDAGTLSAGRVFATREGGALSPSNVRNRVLTPAAKLASGNLEAAGATPLPDGLTPHKLRHTWCSIQAALGVDPRTTMNEGGWTDAAFMLRVYDHEMRRDEESKARLVAFVNGGKRQRKGSSGVLEGAEASRAAEV
jgi:integrase